MIGYILIGYFITGLLVVWGCNIWSSYKNPEQSLMEKEDDSFVIGMIFFFWPLFVVILLCVGFCLSIEFIFTGIPFWIGKKLAKYGKKKGERKFVNEGDER